MNRYRSAVRGCCWLLLGFPLCAQDANPITANLKQSWTNINGLLTRMANKMPEDNYRFKPVPEMAVFGQRMGHVANFNMRACATVKGDQKTLMLSQAPTKSEVIAALKDAADECDAMFASLTDAEVLKTVNAGRGGMRTKLAVIEGTLLEHAQEMYGYMAVYLRLKGIVPPSSDRNER